MLTVLSVEKREPKGRFSAILKRLPLNSLKVTQKTQQGITVNNLEYISRNGRIDWSRICRAAKEGRVNLVYSGGEEIPQDCGIVPFVPASLRQRLCGNMVLEVLELMKEMPPKLRIGLYDPWGDFCDLAEHILRFTSDFVVVTKNVGLYTEQAGRLLSETGAVLCVSRNMCTLSDCGLIVSPDRIDEKFTPMTKAVLLTSREPCVPLSCRVYCRYSFRLPVEFEELRPEKTDAEFFGGALYSLCSVYSLGSLVPFVCMSAADTQTTLSLRKYFVDCFST